MPKKLTTKEFIARAHKVHGQFYNYDQVEYSTAKRKITIICPSHGAFLQAPTNHLNGNGCPECKREKCGDARRLTKEDFLEKALSKYGETFKYDLKNYKTRQSKITVTCPTHGKFQITPKSFLKATHGCPKCGNERIGDASRLSTSEFIKRSKEIHGDRYDYSKSEHLSFHEPVEIICPDHGTFFQQAGNHLNGAGCLTCARKKQGKNRANQARKAFVTRAQEVHGSKYLYEKTEYVTAKTPVIITCKQHGDFEQTPDNHLNGANGCPSCGGHAILTREVLLDRAQQQHGNRYTYNLPDVMNAKDYTWINCPEHGPFRQMIDTHCRGGGCPACAGNKRFDTTTYLERCQEIHGDLYDYSKTEFKGRNEPVTIICKDHGPFETLAGYHIYDKSGCQKCSASQIEMRVAQWLETHGITFIKEWTDHDCIQKRKLRFDFFAPSLNLLIETDGAQHFSPTRWGNMSHEEAAEKFKTLQESDKTKNSWAEANGYELIRVRYDENIEEVLSQKLAPVLRSQKGSLTTTAYVP